MAVGDPGFACQGELLDLFEELVDVIFCAKNRDGVYTAVNHAFVRRTGRRSKRDVIGRRASDLFEPALAERYEEQDTELFATGQPVRDQLELIRRVDGSLGWYLTSKLAVTEPGASPGTQVVVGLVSISRDLGTPRSDAVAMESLTHFVDHVQDNLHRGLRIADLAAVAGCSESQLDRRVRSVFGMSTTQYLLRTRVERATRLLVETDRSLARIATDVGFYDQADFTRRFARLTNTTPARFRADAAAPNP